MIVVIDKDGNNLYETAIKDIAEWRRMHEKNSTDGIAESVDRAGGMD